MSLISLIITAYNAEKLLPATLESLSRQTCQDWECWIVDDGSSDATGAVVAKMQDARFKLLSPGRVGRGRALNLGIQAAQGEFIAIQDADDLSHPKRLETQLAIFKIRPEIAVLGTDQVIMESGDAVIAQPAWQLADGVISDVSERLLLKNPLSHTSLMVRTSVIREIDGYDESRKNLYDWDLLLRLYARGHHIYHYSEPLVLKRIHVGQFFEGRKRYHYVKNCHLLNLRARKLFGRSVLWLPMFWGLFVYRLFPWSLRRVAHQILGLIR